MPGSERSATRHPRPVAAPAGAGRDGQDHELLDQVLRWSPGSDAYGVAGARIGREPRRGRRALGRVVAMVLLAPCLLVFGCGWYGAKAAGLEDLRREARADRLVHQTIDAIAAWSFDSVSAMDGASILEHASREHSDFRVDLAVTPGKAGMLEVQAILRDNRTSREMARFVTYRGRS